MRPIIRPFLNVTLAACVFAASASLTAFACTQQELSTIRDASAAREQLCSSLAMVSTLSPKAQQELAPALKACLLGEQVEAVAAAISQCSAEPTVDGGTK